MYNTSSASPPRVWGLWRINFSRVEWHVQVVDGKYQKSPGPEDNWVGTFSSEKTCRFDAFILVHESFNTPFRFEMCVVNSRTAELAQMPRAKLQPTNRQTDQSINQSNNQSINQPTNQSINLTHRPLCKGLVADGSRPDAFPGAVGLPPVCRRVSQRDLACPRRLLECEGVRHGSLFRAEATYAGAATKR